MLDPAAALGLTVEQVVGVPLMLERPSDEAHGDYATNVALRLARERNRSPRDIATELAAMLQPLDGVEAAEVAGPGFINLRLSDGWHVEALKSVLAAGADFGGRSAATPQRIQVELVSANPTGPISVASARNGALGDCIARLLSFAGHTVEREYYYNDSGTQMDRFRASVEAVRNGQPIPEDGYRGSYLDGLAALDGDPVPVMLEQIEQSLERFRIRFDSWARQSVLEERLPAILPRLDTYEKDGAVWARSGSYGDDDDRVILRSTTGLPTYRAADIPYLADKLDRGFERAIYVLGADHHSTARWYPAIAQMLSYDVERVEVVLYQFVHLTKGGESTKMSKRAGDVVLLDELVDEIGVDAARWYLINRGPDQTIEIDIDLAAEKTNKNPVFYVQYAHARIAGILRNADEQGRPFDPVTRLSGLSAEGTKLEVEERELIKRLLEFPAVVREATERRGPHAIPTYAIRVADDFHRFYHHHKVLGSDEEQLRLGLCAATRDVVGRCLDLIGVSAPDRM